MHHFIAHSPRYPFLRFNVPALKPLLLKKGLLEPATWVKFDSGFLDTKAAGWTEEEAALIHEQIEKLHAANVRLEFLPDDPQEAPPQGPKVDVKLSKPFKIVEGESLPHRP